MLITRIQVNKIFGLIEAGSYQTYKGLTLRTAAGLTILVLLLTGMGTVQAEILLPDLSQAFPVVPQMPGRLKAEGTLFELNDSDYLNITLQSSEPVRLVLESVPEMVTMYISSASGVASTIITIGGFLPLATYHKYEDDYG